MCMRLPASCALPDGTLASPINVLDAGVGGPWPVEQGGDVSTAYGPIRNLCSNVTEWSATPARGRYGSRVVADELLLPWGDGQDAGEYYFAGGCFQHPQFDFSERDRYPRDAEAEWVGFRCALRARIVDEAFRQKDGAGYEFTTF